ncbi:MAG: 30S ribosomal protein S9 [Chloroflexi bacterium]|nr:30S ribosomal protein S9 [Chloroflexota bacterium]
MTEEAARYIEAVGRRKESSARVRIYPDVQDGQILVNDKPLEVYFPRERDRIHLMEPLKVVGLEGAFYITVQVKGGGISGQAGAIRLGIARALVEYNPEFRSVMRRGGFLTRDPRVKERKKYGLKRARKAPQYTKR